MLRTGKSVQDLIDEWDGLANDRLMWERYWRDIAKYVLPQTDGFDAMFAGKGTSAINAVVEQPVKARQSEELYDMTSLWAIERLTAGLLSLKTPETEFWHNLQVDALFGEEPTYQEKTALERLRNYMFKVRANPKTGFWPAHKSAIRSMCAFGDGWTYCEEMHGTGPSVPYRFEFMPLSELYPGISPNGQPNRMFRAFTRTAEQVVRKFKAENVSPQVLRYAQDPQQKHTRVTVLHAVRPREDEDRVKLGVMGSEFRSCYILPDDKFEIGESGYFEFPFNRYAWSNTGTRPYSEGPVAYALGEIKSMQELAKNELLASAASLRPAMGVASKNTVRLNFNPGVSNPGMVTEDGKPKFIALNSGARPDFAQAVMESRRMNLREMLYLNLWQLILGDKGDTATQALIKAQEKGEMFGPVGISLNEGLSNTVDREIGILGRKRAFVRGSPLEMPDSTNGKNVSPAFSSPLDRLRRMGELNGVRQVIGIATELTGGDPARAASIFARIDDDEVLDIAQEILGAPVKMLRDKDAANEDRAQQGQKQAAMEALAAMGGAGEAAKAIGEGAQAVAGGAEAVGNSPKTQQLGRNMPGMVDAATQGAAVPA